MSFVVVSVRQKSLRRSFEITPDQLRLLDLKIEEGRSRVAVDIHAGNLNVRLKRYEE
ncbi:MAG: hypothetical protein Q6A85_10475 [Enterococcus mundtii]|nr:hypothetical protein [Enterococcus mundtii]